MILAVDVRYDSDTAHVSGVLFDQWEAASSIKVTHSVITRIETYESGRFYKRELPCILQLLNEHNLQPDVIVIDGYVYLDGYQSPGLGKHLFDSLASHTPVIGVAKTAFKGIGQEFELYRGNSKKPLFITAVGCALDEARECIKNMHGRHRIPTLLKLADRLSKEIN